jgi:hypothetical protein
MRTPTKAPCIPEEAYAYLQSMPEKLDKRVGQRIPPVVDAHRPGNGGSLAPHCVGCKACHNRHMVGWLFPAAHMIIDPHTGQSIGQLW